MTSQRVEPKEEESNRLRKDFQVVKLGPVQGTLNGPKVGGHDNMRLAGFQTSMDSQSGLPPLLYMNESVY